MKFTGKIFQTGAMVALALMPVVVLAATLPNPTPPVSGTGISVSEIIGLINQIARWLIAVSLVIATIVIIWGGIQYMFTAKGDEGVIKSAWSKIKGGVVGAAIALGVGVILQTVANIVTRQALQ